MRTVTKRWIHFMMYQDFAQHALGRALVHLRNRQNVDERIEKASKYHNERGFCSMDAKAGTEDAAFYERNGYLPEHRVEYWKTRDRRGTMRIAKYHAQLNEEAARKEEMREAA